MNSLGGILYRCLDYGLSEGEERELSTEVTNLIEELTTPLPKRDDEGVDGLEDGLPLSIISNIREVNFVFFIFIFSIFHACTKDFFSPQMCLTACADRSQQPGSHQRAVCRALYWHAVELRQFLNDVSDVQTTADEQDGLRELDKQAWVRLDFLFISNANQFTSFLVLLHFESKTF